jgi:hypothetical protein
MVISSFGGGFWRWYRNDGTGAFALVEEFPALANPSCAVLFDADADGDLDLALTDEIADVVTIMENGGASACSAAPRDCREPTLARKSTLRLVQKPGRTDRLVWRWARGPATAKVEFGDPVGTDDYELCLYEDGTLGQSFRVPAGGTCRGAACWKEISRGFRYRDRDLTPDGILALRLIEGLVDGTSRIVSRGKGSRLALPAPGTIAGVLDVQLQRATGGACFGATYSPPYKKNAGGVLVALSDAPAPPSTTSTTTTTTSTTSMPLPPSWAAIHAQVIGPTCGGCHGGSGGLSGLADCANGHANLVDVASTELPSMDRVEPGDSATSWLMHKLDGTQGMFTAQCQGGFCGSQMPLGGMLAADVRDAIRTWIDTGAVDDCP